MAQFLTILLILLRITLHCDGAPSTPDNSKSNCANFDNLPENPGGFDPSQDPVGTYNGISYAGYVVATQKNSAAKYFEIPSPPNIISSSTGSQASFGGTSAIRINHTATTQGSSFTLSTLRLACLVTSGTFTSNAEGCTVLFVGNKQNGDESVTYEYEYPNENTSESDGSAVFGTVTFPRGWTGLSEVFLTTTSVQNGVFGVNTLLDDVCLSIQR